MIENVKNKIKLSATPRYHCESVKSYQTNLEIFYVDECGENNCMFYSFDGFKNEDITAKECMIDFQDFDKDSQENILNILISCGLKDGRVIEV